MGILVKRSNSLSALIYSGWLQYAMYAKTPNIALAQTVNSYKIISS